MRISHVRKVEQAIHNVLAGLNTPLVVAAEEPLASMYRSLNSDPGQADELIEGKPDQKTDAELEDAAIPILDRLYSRKVKAAIALYDQLKPRRATRMSPMPRMPQPQALSSNFWSILTRFFPVSSATSMAA
jgi:hypothetical protein